MAKAKAKSKWGTAKDFTAFSLPGGGRIIQRLQAGGEEPIWYHELPDRRRISLGTADRKTAMQKALSEPEPAAAPRAFQKPKASAALTMEKALEEYEEWYRGKDKAGKPRHKASSADATVPNLERFIEFVGRDLDTRALTEQHIDKFLSKFEGKSPIYIKNEFGRVRGLLKKIDKWHKGAVDLSCLNADEDLGDDESTGCTIPDQVTIDAALRKLDTHPWIGDFVRVIYETGMRPGEVLAVRGVDLDGDRLSIEPYEGWSPKSKHSKRKIYLNETALRILTARKEMLFDKRAPLFSLPTGKMRNVKYVSKQYRELLGDAKEFDSMKLYLWKHIFCSLHAAATRDGKPNPAYMDMHSLSAQIGHAPGSTKLLETWYVDRDHLRSIAPPSLSAPPVQTVVTEMKKG